MAIHPEKYIRTPFEVEAVEVTLDNMLEVARWCNGSIETDTEGALRGHQFIKVRVKKPLNERQTRAYQGDWVLLAKTSNRDTGPAGFKVYTPKAFATSFQKQVDNMLDVVGRMEDRVEREEKAESQDEVLFSEGVRP